MVVRTPHGAVSQCQSVSGCHNIIMSDCEGDSTEIDSIRSHGEAEDGHHNRDDEGEKEVSQKSEKEKSEDKEDSSVDGFVVMEAAPAVPLWTPTEPEENETDRKPSITEGCGMEYKEEQIMVDDLGSKEEPTDVNSTKSPCPTPSNETETDNTNAEEINEESIEPSSNQEKDAVEEKSKSEEIDISEDERAMMVNMFKHFDSDGTGAMSIAELGNFMRAIGENT